MIIQSYATAVNVLIKINQLDLFSSQHFGNMLDPNVQRKKFFNEFSTETWWSACDFEVHTLGSQIFFFFFFLLDTFIRGGGGVVQIVKPGPAGRKSILSVWRCW